MKKVYTIPRIEVVTISTADIICSSTQNGGSLQSAERWWEEEWE